MKPIIGLLALSFLGSVAGFAQVDPSATGAVPASGANLVYAFRYGQSALMSSQAPTMQMSNLTATLGYRNREPRLPFTMEYGGGYIWTLSGPGYQTGQFHRLMLTQGITLRRWNAVLTNNMSYLPQSPTLGFSGIAGIGEIIGLTGTSSSTSQTILTGSTHVIDNITRGEVSHTLNYATTASVSGGYELLRFPNDDGININTVTGQAQLGRRISARTTLIASAAYTQFSYQSTIVTISTGTGLLGFSHRWTRNLTSDLSAGPQKIKSSVSALVPSKLSYALNADTSYKLRNSEYSAAYSHGTNGGSGYLIGGMIDTASGSMTHMFGPNTQLGLAGGYFHTVALSGLSGSGTTNAEYGGAQATWNLGNKLMVFASYSAVNQTSTSVLSGTALSGLRHIIGFGFGYTSRETRLRQ
jgi:hypothetical protein